MFNTENVSYIENKKNYSHKNCQFRSSFYVTIHVYMNQMNLWGNPGFIHVVQHRNEVCSFSNKICFCFFHGETPYTYFLTR